MELYPLNSIPSLGEHERLFGAAGATRELLPLAIVVAVIVFLIGAGLLGAGITFYIKTRGYRPLGGIVLGSFFLLIVAIGSYMAWDFLRTAPWQVRTGVTGILVHADTPLLAGNNDVKGNVGAPNVLSISYDQIEWVRQAEELYLYPLKSDLDSDIQTRQATASCLDIRLRSSAAAAAARALGRDAETRKAIAQGVGTEAGLASFVRPVRMVDDRTLRIQWYADTKPGVEFAVKGLSEKVAVVQPVSAAFPGDAYQKDPAAWGTMSDAKRDEYVIFLAERGMIGLAEKMLYAFYGTLDSEERIRSLFFRGVEASRLQTRQQQMQQEVPTRSALQLIVKYRPVIAGSLFVLALLLGWPLYRNVRDARASSEWPTTRGTILESQYGRPGSPRQVFIRYKYRGQGQEYESNRISFNKYSDRTGQDMVAQYPLGSEVKVYYDFDNPSQAVLEPGFILTDFSTPPFVLEILGLLIAMLVALFVVSEPRAKIAEQARHGPSRSNAAESGGGSDVVARSLPVKPGSQMSEEEIFAVLTNGTNEEIIRAFDSGADVNTRHSESGETPLMAAVSGNVTEMVRYLVNKGADVNAVSKNGVTALGTAALRGYTDIVKILVEDRADVRHRDANGLNALFYAAARGHLDIARTLMAKGADIRIRAKNGATALIDAIQVQDEGQEWNGNVELIDVVRFMLESGVDASVKDNDGRTALDYAVELEADPDVIRLLKKKTGR